MNPANSFLLASGSPRRRELLAMAGFSFVVHPTAADETLPPATPSERACQLLARRKAAAALPFSQEKLVVGADTLVDVDGLILGKPATAGQAEQMLSLLSGRTHCVYTGVCLRTQEWEDTFFCRTFVTFEPLSQQEIRNYIDTGEPMDKAGGYGIQGRGALLVRQIEGDYYNVVGFPLSQFYRRLCAFPPKNSTAAP